VISAKEQVFLDKNHSSTVRPFSSSAGVTCRSRSQLLERALVDFGADESFANAARKIREHYGVTVSESTTRLDVEKHAKQIERLDKKECLEYKKADAMEIIGELDGSMVPIVSQKQCESRVSDKRKNKTYEWKEARLAVARAKGRVDANYAAVIGPSCEAGDQLAKAVKRAGENIKTTIHCVADGAPWIAEQVELKFGSKARFLLDFYHASEYLAEASKCCNPSSPKEWLNKQQKSLKNGCAQNVFAELQKHIEHECEANDSCPALKCLNYLLKRESQLDYKAAIASDLPIGSGAVEGGHRSVIQKRLKISGAWWRLDNAQSMLSVRTLRANGQWARYWTKLQTEKVGFAPG